MTDTIYQNSMSRARALKIIEDGPDDIDENIYVIGEPREGDASELEVLGDNEIVGLYREVRENEIRSISDEGFDNLNDVLTRYFGITITREFFDEHEQKFVEGVDTSYGFYEEANDGALSDTLVRDYISSVLAGLFTDHAYWPTIGDGDSKSADFQKQYWTNVAKTEGVMPRDEK